MRREWEPEELIACWTLVEADWRLVANKSGATRLGFVVLLKFFELEERFPRHAGEPPAAAVVYLAGQVTVVRRPRRDDLLARRTQEHLHLQPASVLLGQ